MSPQIWMNPQTYYDLELLDMHRGDKIQKEVEVLA
jgi:hypothetical protein